MTQFDDREKAEERLYANREEVDFKIAARRNKALGAWVAELLGKKGDAAQEYINSVISSDLILKGDEDVFAKVFADLKDAKVDVSDHVIQREMSKMLDEARKEIQG